MTGGTLRVYDASDESFADILEYARHEEMAVIDMRTTWSRWRQRLRTLGWGVLIAYVMIAHYCRFKFALGLAVTTCTCS